MWRSAISYRNPEFVDQFQQALALMTMRHCGMCSQFAKITRCRKECNVHNSLLWQQQASRMLLTREDTTLKLPVYSELLVRYFSNAEIRGRWYVSENSCTVSLWEPAFHSNFNSGLSAFDFWQSWTTRDTKQFICFITLSVWDRHLTDKYKMQWPWSGRSFKKLNRQKILKMTAFDAEICVTTTALLIV